MEWGASEAVAFSFKTSTPRNQPLRNGPVATLDCDVQCRKSLLIYVTHVGPRLEENTENLLVAMLGRAIQRRASSHTPARLIERCAIVRTGTRVKSSYDSGNIS